MKIFDNIIKKKYGISFEQEEQVKVGFQLFRNFISDNPN